jgi:hypothetical protein
MLTVAIAAQHHVVTLLGGEDEAGLHRSANADVVGHLQHDGPSSGRNSGRLVGGAVVNHQQIGLGQMLARRCDDVADALGFVESRDHDQNAGLGIHAD